MAQVIEQERPVRPHAGHYAAEFRRVLQESATQPRWLVRSREAAMAQFERLGFPTTRQEAWRFTSVAPIAERAFSLAPHVPGVTGFVPAVPNLVAQGAGPALQLVCVNGHFNAAASQANGLPPGVRVSGLEAALRDTPDLLEPYLDKLTAAHGSAFTSLNTAFLRDGLVILVAPGAVLERPIEVLFARVPGQGDTVSHPRLLVIAGEHSQLTVLERYVGAGQAFTNAVSEVWVGPHSHVDHYKLQEESEHSFHIATMFVHCSRSAAFSSHALTFGGSLVRNEAIATLAGEGVDCTLNGLYLGRGRALVDNHTTIDHAMPHCGSHEVYKGILGEQSKAVFNGKIIVRQDAQKTDAKQTNKALLLSDEATINTKPELEIFANDVKCTHGAAIGQLDDNAMFYLRSRGLGVKESRALLVHAFAGDILGRVKIDPLRHHLEAVLTARLPHVD